LQIAPEWQSRGHGIETRLSWKTNDMFGFESFRSACLRFAFRRSLLFRSLFPQANRIMHFLKLAGGSSRRDARILEPRR